MTEKLFDRDDILFVFGSARGGTTYLTNFLDDWFSFGMGPEGTFIKPLYARANKYGDLSQDKNLYRIAADISNSDMATIMRDIWPSDIQIDITPEIIIKHVKNRTYGDVVFATFAAVAELRGKENIGSKDPSFWTYWRLLDEMFGDRARYLCVVRDGRDVALSLFRKGWGEKSIYMAAKRWGGYLQNLEEMQKTIPAERITVIKYETVLTQPELAVSQLEMATNVPLTDSKKAAAIDAIRTNKLANNFNKWKTKLSERDAAIFESIAGKWLESYEYDLLGKKINVGLHERVFYQAQETWRKAILTMRGIIGKKYE
jgi:sulfotransferase family protein